MRPRNVTGIAGIGAVLGCVALAVAQQTAPPEPGTPRPFQVPELRDLSLPNGLGATLVAYGDVPQVTVRLITLMGNVNEGPDQIWLADLTADLLQEGTATRGAAEIAVEVAGMGGALTVGVGANTTVIGGDVLAEFAPQMVALVADLAQHPQFPDMELPRLRANLLRQLSIARSQPQALAQERFRAALYPDHPYGRIFPTEEMLQGYTLDEVRAFFTDNFGAARSHLYVAGRFDADATETAIREAFGGWARGPDPEIEVPSPRRGRTVHLIDRPGAVQSTIYMGLPVVDPSHPDYLALQVTNTLLGGYFSSRITMNLREDKGYTYSPSSSLSARFRDAFWAQLADVTTGVTGPALKEIFFEVDRLRREPPPQEELQAVQNYVAGNFVLQNSSRGGIVGQIGFLKLHGLPEDYLRTYVQRVHALTPQDVQRVARTYLDPDTMTVVVVGDRGVIEEQVRPFGDIQR